jgi:hypothetical protein
MEDGQLPEDPAETQQWEAKKREYRQKEEDQKETEDWETKKKKKGDERDDTT